MGLSGVTAYVDPESGEQLFSRHEVDDGKSTGIAYLCSEGSSRQFPIIRGIPRFQGNESYAKHFGDQWTHFSATQLDSATGASISAERFWSSTGWSEHSLKGTRILDAGCGAGRFAEIALSAGAEVYAVDLTDAVDAAAHNLWPDSLLHIAQADLYRLPFSLGTFDYVYSLGVIQHTPNPLHAISMLARMVKPGGALCVDTYWRRLRDFPHPRHLWRLAFKQRSFEEKAKLVNQWVPRLLSVNRRLRKVPGIGTPLTRLMPVADYTHKFDLSREQVREWAILDTLDWVGPQHDNPLSMSQLRHVLPDDEWQNVEVLKAEHLVLRAKRKTH